MGGAPDQFVTPALSAERASADFANANFMGWRRENGRVGVRNHVVILPLDDLSNAVCEAVANNVKGTLALPHAYGRLQFGEDLELHFRTLIGIGSNPNVAAVVVVGIEDRLDQLGSSRASPRLASPLLVLASRDTATSRRSLKLATRPSGSSSGPLN